MPSSPIPTSVMILGKTYTIALNELDGLLGCVDHSSQHIQINTGQHPESERDSLLHEIFHAVCFQTHLKLSERQVHALGAGLYQILTQNPDLVNYVRGA